MKSLLKRLNPVARYGPCIGITIWRWGRFKIELWWAPADFAPEEHTHENSDGEFLILWARNREIYRKTHFKFKGRLQRFRWKELLSPIRKELHCGPGDSYIAHTPPWHLKTLSVRAGTPHAFKTGTSCMIWLCLETWKKGVAVTSVAEDFHPVRITNYEQIQIPRGTETDRVR